MLYLKSATTGKFEDQKKKDLADAQRALTQAVTTGGQEKNPAAWYYLARYYIMSDDAQGIDSAFTRAQVLKPDCKNDIDIWRRYVWVPAFNAGDRGMAGEQSGLGYQLVPACQRDAARRTDGHQVHRHAVLQHRQSRFGDSVFPRISFPELPTKLAAKPISSVTKRLFPFLPTSRI